MVYLPHWPIPSSFGKREINYETVFLRMQEVLQKLDNPQQKLPPVIHITGTNGKGSTLAFLAAILQASGLKIHSYTSPHLHDCNERILLNGEKISDNFLFENMEEARIAAAATPLTFFEGFTIGAFLAFSKVPADLLLIETGMGTRIDATNIIAEKLATIIAPISFDHTEYLGDSIAKIAFEKAHIIRPQTPVIIGPQPKQAQEIIELIAQDQNAPMIRYDKEFAIILDEENGSFDLTFFTENLQKNNSDFEKKFRKNSAENSTTKIELLNLPSPALAGQHQYINAATAIAAALSLPFAITQKQIELGLARVQWPSRLEKVTNNLYKILQNSASEIFLDGAHNQAGAFAIARFLMEEKKRDLEIYQQNFTAEEKFTPKKTFVICGFTKNKCRPQFLENFIGVADEMVAIRVDGEPNPEDAEVISKIATEIGLPAKACNDLLDAIYYLKKLSDNMPCRIVICGSLHLARDVKKFGAKI